MTMLSPSTAPRWKRVTRSRLRPVAASALRARKPGRSPRLAAPPRRRPVPRRNDRRENVVLIASLLAALELGRAEQEGGKLMLVAGLGQYRPGGGGDRLGQEQRGEGPSGGLALLVAGPLGERIEI